MENKLGQYTVVIVLALAAAAVAVNIGGCSGYSNRSLYQPAVRTVYVEMFGNETFWRNIEYELTDALAKRIEAHTPYKIISDRDRADTIITGQITSIADQQLTTEAQTARALEKEMEITAIVSWKSLRTGELLLDRQSVSESASYSQWQSQGQRYGGAVAANQLAVKIVELMEIQW